MNVLYVCKVSGHQANGNQIDIPKNIGIEFFNVPKVNIERGRNTEVNVCHIKDLETSVPIEIQPATNLRWSSKLNSFLSENGDKLTEGDLLVFEKINRLYCVRCIKKADSKYAPLVDLMDTDEKHMLLTGYLGNQPNDTTAISSLYRPYITAIKSKPFLLLAGISGTGKSRIVRELARACWDEDSEEFKAQKPKNFEMIQVKPNWHDSSELIGYVSRIDGVRYVVGPFLRFVVKAINDPDTPYFLCLDEMNLAPVEQYFAEYLSVIESRKLQKDGSIITDPIIDYSNTEEYQSLINQLFPNDDDLRKAYLTEDGGSRLRIPQNLIVVGTVNMDETTFSFSRKVLDRAMTIEMNEVNLRGGLEGRYEKIGKLSNTELLADAVEGVDVYPSHSSVCNTAINYLEKINAKLNGTPFKIAYRTRNEVLLYVVNNLPYNKDVEGIELHEGEIIARALDEITNMKILSRIEGDETKVSAKFLSELKSAIQEELNSISDNPWDDEGGEGYNKSVSLAKITEMENRLNSGYTSYWS